MAQINLTVDSELIKGLFYADVRDEAFATLVPTILDQVLNAQASDLAPRNWASYNVRKKRKKTSKGAERRWQERTTQLNRSLSSCGRLNCIVIKANRSLRPVECLKSLSKHIPLAKRIRWDEHQRRPTHEGIGKRERTLEEVGSRASVGYLNSSGCEFKKLLSPAKRLAAVKYAVVKHHVAERRACRVLQINRNSCRYEPVKRADEDEIHAAIIRLVTNYGRVGYRMVTYMLRNEGILINHKRVERIWREEGLKLPKKQIKKRRLWLTDGSCIRLRAEHMNHVWSYDFVEDKTRNGRKIRFLNVLDEYTHECLASVPRRSWRSNDVIELLSDLMLTHGVPEYMRSDNGSEFTAKQIRKWLSDAGSITAFIEPGSPWENGYIESFNARMRAEFLNGELFDTMYEAQVLTQRWVRYYNQVRPHSSLGGRPPAPQTVIPIAA